MLRSGFLRARPVRKSACALLCALLAAALLTACAVPPPSPAEVQPDAPSVALPDAAALFDLLRRCRFDLVPVFAEGAPPTGAADYLPYAFFTRAERSGTAGRVPETLLAEIAQTQFGADGLTREGVGADWVEDGDGWRAALTDAPAEPLCLPRRVSAEARDGRTVYTVQIHVGDNGAPPTDADFAAARAACADGTAYPLQNCTIYTVRYALRGDVPLFLSKTPGDGLSQTELFDLARAYRFDLLPFFGAADGDSPPAGAYLDWLAAVCPDAAEERGGQRYFSDETVAALTARYFTAGAPERGLCGQTGWTDDGAGYLCAAAPSAPPLCRAESVLSELAPDGASAYTVTLAFYAPADGTPPDAALAAAFRAALAAEDGSATDGKPDTADNALAPADSGLPDGLTRTAVQTVSLRFEPALYPRFSLHLDATETAAETPAARYFDYFRAHSWQIDPFPALEDGVISDEALAVFALQGVAHTQRVDWAAGIAQADLDAVTRRYFGVTATGWETAYSTVLPDGRVTATGWCTDGAARLVLQAVERGADGLFSGTFEVYDLPETLNTHAVADAQLRAGTTEPWAAYRTGTAFLVWEEVADSAPEGFFLRYRTCRFTPATTD